jgi:hypothetical protein
MKVQLSIGIQIFVYFPVIWCEQLLVLSTVISILIASVVDLHVSSCETRPIGQALHWIASCCTGRVFVACLLPNPDATFLRSYPSFGTSEGPMDRSMRGPRHRISSRQQFEDGNLRTEESVLDCWIAVPVRRDR